MDDEGGTNIAGIPHWQNLYYFLISSYIFRILKFSINSHSPMNWRTNQAPFNDGKPYVYKLKIGTTAQIPYRLRNILEISEKDYNAKYTLLNFQFLFNFLYSSYSTTTSLLEKIYREQALDRSAT